MLHTLDQWAFQILMLLNSLFGVTELPTHSNLDWTIEQNWKELPDHSYEIILKSTDIIPQCLGKPNAYILFPQVYMGYHEIWIDNQKIYSNALGDKKYLNSFFSKPIVACDKVSSGAKVMTYKINSYIKYFATLESYPLLLPYKPRATFLYGGLYVTSLAICICLGLIGAILLRKDSSLDKTMNFILQDLLFALAVLCNMVGEFGSLDVGISHVFLIIGLWGGFYCFVYPFFINENLHRRALIGLAITGPLLLLLVGSRNLTQLLLLLPIPFFFTLVYAITLRIFRDKSSEYQLPEKVLLLAILFFGIMDAYIAVKSRQGILHLSVLFILLSCFKFFRIIRLSQKKRYELTLANQKLAAEKNILSEVSKLHEVHREIIHDIKSPLTSLSMVLGVNPINRDLILKVQNQINELLVRIEHDNVRRAPDWYSILTLRSLVEEIIELKSATSLLDIRLSFSCDRASKQTEIFFDPVFTKVVLSELIDNSAKQIKKGAKELTIDIGINLEAAVLLITLSDDGPGLSLKEQNLVGEKMTPAEGGGVGLHGIKKRIIECGGSINFNQILGRGFSCKIQLPLRR